MPTRVNKHNRKGTKGVKTHSRNVSKVGTVPHTRKKRKSYKVANMDENEIEDRVLSLFVHSRNPTPPIGVARDVYKELGLKLPYEGKTRIGHVNRYAGLDTYYLSADHKHDEKDTKKFLKANIHHSRPAFNRIGKDLITNRHYTTGDYETGDKLTDEYYALEGAEDLRVKWLKENL